MFREILIYNYYYFFLEVKSYLFELTFVIYNNKKRQYFIYKLDV